MQDARDRVRQIKIVSNNEKIIEQLERLRVAYFLTIANTGDKKLYFLTIANTGDKKLDCAYQHVAKALDIAIDIIEKGGFE